MPDRHLFARSSYTGKVAGQSPLQATHDGKGHVMVPEGQFMAENDDSWEGSFPVFINL
jgi:hypothetical protein